MVSEGALAIRVLLAALATWRVTHLLAREDGPGDLLVKWRARLGQRVWGRLMDCFHCLSLWVAAPFALWLARGAAEWVIAWLALSAAACLLERLGHDPVVIHPLGPDEPGGPPDGMLRSKASGTDAPPERCEPEPHHP
jgi:hypothetical protein